MRGEHVIVGGDNRKIGSGARAKRLFIGLGTSRKAVREIGARKSAAARPGCAHCFHAGKIVLPRSPAARANALRNLGNRGVHHGLLLAAGLG